MTSAKPPKPRRSLFRVCLQILFFGSAIGLISSIIFAWIHAADPHAHSRYSDRLRRLQAIDAALNQHLLMARSGLVVHYDALAVLSADLRSAHRALSPAPAFLSSTEALDASLDVVAQGLAQKFELIEQFKRENAIFRNSLAFFPTAAASLADRLAAEDSSRFTQLRDLLIHVLLFNQFSTRDLLPLVEAELASLTAAFQATPSSVHVKEIDSILLHARSILTHKPSVDALLSQILALPTAQEMAFAEATYARLHSDALGTSLVHRSVVFVFALLTLIHASVYVIDRLRQSARALTSLAHKLRATNEALRLEQQREKELSDLKNRFVSMASHEFRTPLSVIMSSTELLQNYRDRWPPEKINHHFSRISASVQSMTGLLEGVLTIGRADAGALPCRPTPSDLPSLCALAMEAALQGSQDPSRIRFQLSLKDPTIDPHAVLLDPNLLERILSNLLSNALKYSPQDAPIDFFVSLGLRAVEFTVRDFGIGIAPEHLPNLFQSFHRGENVGNIAGTGLGLAIVKRAIDLHRGSIEVSSTLGSGTTMQIRIPTDGQAHEESPRH